MMEMLSLKPLNTNEEEEDKGPPNERMAHRCRH